MQDSEQKITARIVTLSSAGMITAAFVYAFHTNVQGPINFTWCWIAVPILIAIVVTFVVIVQMVRRVSVKRGPFYWFMLLLIANLGFSYTFLAQVISGTPQMEIFFQGFLPATWIPVPVLLLLFTISYVSKKEIPLRPYSWAFLLSAFITTIYISGMTPLAGRHIADHIILTPWGYSDPPVASAGFVYAWGSALSLVSFVLLIRAYKRETSRNARNQLRIFIIAIAQYFGMAALFDIGLRTLLDGHWLPPITFVYITAMSTIIGYGIFRYGLFQINPASLSEQILHDLAEAVLGVDTDLTIEFANSGAQGIFKRSPDSLKGKPVGILLSQNLEGQLAGRLKGSERRVVFDDVQIERAGETVDVMLTVSKIYGDKERLAGYIFVFQDISELKKKTIELAHEKENVERKVVARTRELHEERAKLHASIESLALGFALIGRDGSILIQNHMLETMLQVTTPLMTVDDLAAKMHGFALARHCAAVQKPDAPKILKDITFGDRVLHIFITGVSVQADNEQTPIGAVVLIEDITEAKVLERSRDEFFSIASHELRTPLTAIRGNASMLLQYYPEAMKDKNLANSLSDIHDSSIRLIEIVNDFLSLSRLEQKRMAFDFRPVSLDRVIESVIYEMKVSLREKGLSVKFDGMTLGELPQVWVDEARLKQVIYNLVGNAVKFTDKGGITITTLIEASKVKVFINDTGKGIGIDSRKLLFHKFQQAGESILTRDTTRGTGLGLYISKLIIEDMGGRIVLEDSDEGRGSTFSFTLPIATDKQIEHAASQKTHVSDNHQ